MKGVIPAPDIAKIFHLTPDIEVIPSYTKLTLDTMFFKLTPRTVKYLISILDTNLPLQGPQYYIHLVISL